MSNCNLYLKPLPEDITEDQIRKVFDKYGSIKSVKIASKDNKFFGYVLYEDYLSA